MAGHFELSSRLIGALPVVNHFLDRLGLGKMLDRHVPSGDPRLLVSPATVLGVVVRNLVVDHEPLYSFGEWALPYDPCVLGLCVGEAGALNDDRVGRALALLFDADRASLLTEVVLSAVSSFGIDCDQLHNDSTTVTFTGARRASRPSVRGGKQTAAARYGHNKDHRPDLRQLLWILTITADGAVPITYRVAHGNTEDSSTHIASWDQLVGLVGRADFLYVADCKLATREVMDHIADRHGRFVSVLPRSRREDRWFRDFVTRNNPDWTEATRRPSRRRGEPEDVVSTFESPLGSSEGYRIIWIHSSAKKTSDANSRTSRIEASVAGLEDLARRLRGPKCRIKTRVAAEEAAKVVLDDLATSRYFELFICEEIEKTYTAEHHGSPGRETRFSQQARRRFSLTWKLRQHVVRDDAASDGCFPLITNDAKMTPAEVLAAYKYQPNLERRNHILKGHQAVAPVFLRSPSRIEGLMCCHFLALLVGALIERQIRLAMAKENLKTIPLYPEDRDCTAPSAERILQIFAGVERHNLIEGGRVVQVFEPSLTPLQQQVLKLLGIPQSVYQCG
jgi:transposase